MRRPCCLRQAQQQGQGHASSVANIGGAAGLQQAEGGGRLLLPRGVRMAAGAVKQQQVRREGAIKACRCNVQTPTYTRADVKLASARVEGLCPSLGIVQEHCISNHWCAGAPLLEVQTPRGVCPGESHVLVVELTAHSLTLTEGQPRMRTRSPRDSLSMPRVIPRCHIASDAYCSPLP